MTTEYQVRGSSIKSKFDFVRQRFGDSGADQLEARFAGRPGLLPILDSSLYPFSVYDEINRAIAELFYGGDLSKLQEVGRYSAEVVLTTLYKAFLTGRDFPGFLDNAFVLHQRFYNQGTIRFARGSDGRSGTVHMEGAPVYSEADLHIAAGFYRGAALKLGIEELRVQFDAGPSGARFDLSWD